MKTKRNVLLFGIIALNLTIANAQDYMLVSKGNDDYSVEFNNKFKTDYKLIEPLYSNYYKFRDKIVYNKNGAPLLAEYGVIDNLNTILLEPIYEKVEKLGDNGLLHLISIKIDDEIIYNLETKKIIYKGINALLSYENDSLIVFDQNKLFGVINDKNEKIIPFEYTKIEYFKKELFLLKNGILSSVLLENSIKNVKDFDIRSNLINVKNGNKKYSLYDLKGNLLVASKDEIVAFTSSIFQIKDKKKDYIQFPDKYIEIIKFTNSTLDGNYVWIYKQNEVDIYDLKGNLKHNFKNIETDDDGTILESEYSRIKNLIE